MSLCVEPYLRASACRIRDLTRRSTVQQPGNGLFHALAIGFPHAPFTIEASRLQSLEQVDGCRNGYLSAAVRLTSGLRLGALYQDATRLCFAAESNA